MNSQFNLPKQSPVVHDAPLPLTPLSWLGPVPLALKLQFVRPQIRPCQSQETRKSAVLPGGSSKPPVPGPWPCWVPTPGQMVSKHWLLTFSGTVLFEDMRSTARTAALRFFERICVLLGCVLLCLKGLHLPNVMGRIGGRTDQDRRVGCACPKRLKGKLSQPQYLYIRILDWQHLCDRRYSAL